MNEKYNEYLQEHIENVEKAHQWLRDHFEDVAKNEKDNEYFWTHDNSKYSPEEYLAYDEYFYGGNKSFKVVDNFKYAWLHHIHNNPHHWQYWVLQNDDEPEEILEMPFKYVVEMICDWWSFSWKDGKLDEIFDWYEKHKDGMKLHPRTRKLVEDILSRIKKELEKEQRRYGTAR